MDLSYVKTLDVDMPEELVRLKYAGMFKDFEKRAAYHLSRPELPDALKKRIELELHNAKLIEREYTLTEEELVEGLAKYAPGFTAADLDKIADSLDYAFIEGEKRYVSFSVRALFKSHPVMMNWPGSTYPKDDRTFLENVIAKMKEKGGLAVDIDITTGMEIDEKTAKGADLKIHVPFPTEKAFGMKNVRFIESEGECQVAPDTALQRTAHHGGDQLVHVGVLGALGHDQIAVPQDRDLITDLKNLIHLMGDIDERDTLRFQHPHHFKELVYFLYSQRGSRLVQNNDLRIIRNRFGNFTHLPLGDRHIPHGLGQVDGHTELAEQLGRLFLHPAFIHDTRRVGGIAAQEQVVNDVSFQALVQLLVYHSNSVFQGVLWAGKADLLAIEEDLAFILLVSTKEALHHGGLTGAVLAHKSHDRPPFDIQIDAIQHPVPAKGFTHATD